MHRILLPLFTMTLTLLANATPIHALMIDDFDVPGAGQAAGMVAGGSNPTVASSVRSSLGLSVLGDERDLHVLRDAAGDTGSLIIDINSTTGSVLTIAADEGVAGVTTLTWDGADGTAGSIDHTGLGGADLTEGGLHDAIAVSFISIDATASVTIDVYTNAGAVSSRTLAVSAAGTVFFEYADFAGSADFANVGAIEMTIDGTAAAGIGLDGELGSVQTAAVPEPGTAALVGGGLAALAAVGRRRGRARS